MNDTEQEVRRRRQRGYEVKYRRKRRRAHPELYRIEYEEAYARNPGSYKERVKAWRARNREKYRAHLRVYYALKTGKLVKPAVCSQCGGQGRTGRIEAHHPDYTKPLEVVWLCHGCHKAITDALAT